ncbi:MAG TPA: hypothetical protein QF499_00430 [Gammaproteobacteria bacterium]|jgi:hypothetical protein|nr:hypothetical protein [Chromatiales bacterium]MCP4926723.1 hypothetical protein [Gammaproteobacteria bacterium]HJP37581.1 hypothetical protein [Gammaproteobacteria bacterium]
MFSHSVISKTQQMWKFWVGVAALIFGSVAPIFEQSGVSWTVGTVIAVVGYGFTVAFVICPACGQRWFYKGLLDASLYRPLFSKSSCPGCNHLFE